METGLRKAKAATAKHTLLRQNPVTPPSYHRLLVNYAYKAVVWYRHLFPLIVVLAIISGLLRTWLDVSLHDCPSALQTTLKTAGLAHWCLPISGKIYKPDDVPQDPFDAQRLISVYQQSSNAIHISSSLHDMHREHVFRMKSITSLLVGKDIASDSLDVLRMAQALDPTLVWTTTLCDNLVKTSHQALQQTLAIMDNTATTLEQKTLYPREASADSTRDIAIWSLVKHPFSFLEPSDKPTFLVREMARAALLARLQVDKVLREAEAAQWGLARTSEKLTQLQELSERQPEKHKKECDSSWFTKKPRFCSWRAPMEQHRQDMSTYTSQISRFKYKVESAFEDLMKVKRTLKTTSGRVLRLNKRERSRWDQAQIRAILIPIIVSCREFADRARQLSESMDKGARTT